MEKKEKEVIKEFETAQCTVKVFDTGWCVDFYHVYCIKSFHHKNGNVVTRFGTKAQIDAMIRSYKREKRFTL